MTAADGQADALARRCVDKMLQGDRCSARLGIELLEAGAGRARMRLVVTADMTNGHQICHGGVIFTLADTTFACACNGHNRVTVAGGCSIEFLRPARAGDELTAVGVERKRGKQTGICDIEIRNQRGQLVALFRGKSFILDETIL